jgi:hypothetical protein
MPTESKVLEKAQKLVRLANSSEVEEARTAAVALARLMKEEELVLVPRSEIARIEKVIAGAQAMAHTQKGERNKTLALGAIAGVLLGKQFKL